MHPGILARIARSVANDYPMPPARGILQGIVNGQPIQNPAPALIYRGGMNGVRG